MNTDLPPLDLQRFQAFLYKKGYGARKRAATPQKIKQARAARMATRSALKWPNSTAEIKGYSVDSSGQRYAQYSNGRLERMPVVIQ